MAKPSDDAASLREVFNVSAQRVARVYAEALYRAADKAGLADQVLSELETLVTGVLRDSRLAIVFSSAALGRDARRNIIVKAFKDRASQPLYAFLQVLNVHERLELLRPVARAYRELADQRNQRVRVLISSAVPIPDDQLQHLQSELRAHLKLEPVLVTSVDPELLGGMKVRIGDRQYDGTVKTRIEALRTQILARSSHEIQSRRDHFRAADGNRTV